MAYFPINHFARELAHTFIDYVDMPTAKSWPYMIYLYGEDTNELNVRKCNRRVQYWERRVLGCLEITGCLDSGLL